MRNKCVASLLLAVLLLIPALSLADAPGTELYESEDLGISFEYPAGWVPIDPRKAPKAYQIANLIGISVDEVSAIIDNGMVIFYDVANYAPTFKNNMNLGMESFQGITTGYFESKAFLSILKQLVDTMYSGSNIDMKWVLEPKHETRGETLFIACSYDIGMYIGPQTVNTSVYQALVLHDEYGYWFTYSAKRDGITPEIINTMEALLATVSFQ